ncbi:hypothetical protein ABZY36_35385 [Streptomyces sp. NPDC006627]|uniref:hypothetical protein n=1 Tax=Streptomyces sp. NPDC006627 TaxID=3154679 RepID=UPI0033A57EDE
MLITMPVPVEVPVGARLTGERSTVSLSVVAVARCSHGHMLVEEIPDASDTEAVTLRQARWAEEHAETCAGAVPTAA